MPTYIFDSTGGCAKCDGKEEEHPQYPQRPHPYCNCKIYLKKSKHCYELGDITSKNSVGNGKQNGDEIKYYYFLKYEMPMTCLKSGESHLLTVEINGEVDVAKEDYPGEDEMLKEMKEEWRYDAVEECIWSAKDLCGCP